MCFSFTIRKNFLTFRETLKRKYNALAKVYKRMTQELKQPEPELKQEKQPERIRTTGAVEKETVRRTVFVPFYEKTKKTHNIQ